MASQTTSLTIVYSTVYSGADQWKHQSSVSLAFVWGIHRWPVNSPHAQRASIAENVSIWWRHHGRQNLINTLVKLLPCLPGGNEQSCTSKILRWQKEIRLYRKEFLGTAFYLHLMRVWPFTVYRRMSNFIIYTKSNKGIIRALFERARSQQCPISSLGNLMTPMYDGVARRTPYFHSVPSISAHSLEDLYNKEMKIRYIFQQALIENIIKTILQPLFPLLWHNWQLKHIRMRGSLVFGKMSCILRGLSK